MRFICMLNRSGSTWLCDMLNKLPLGYKGGEWFNVNNKWAPFHRKTVDKEAHWRLLSEASADGGPRVIVKCNLSQMRLFEEQVLGDQEEHRYIFLERQDLLGQAISQFILQLRLAGETPAIGALDPAAVVELMAKFGKANGLWRNWLDRHGCEYRRVAYEDVVADPGTEVRKVVAHFDGPELLERIPPGFDYAGARRKNKVPFLGPWREAMARYQSGDGSWREPLEQEVEGESYYS